MEQAKLKIDQTSDLSTVNCEIVIEPIATDCTRLEALLARITADNTHGDQSFDPPVGKELL